MDAQQYLKLVATGEYPILIGTEAEESLVFMLPKKRTGFRFKKIPDDAPTNLNLLNEGLVGGQSFIVSGARVYNDTGKHPEYASNEVRFLSDILAEQDDRKSFFRTQILRAREKGFVYGLFHHNNDGGQSTYGHHTNFLIPAILPLPVVHQGLLPFIATAYLFAGAGDYVLSQKNSHFELSQRSRFMRKEISPTTTSDRGLINTREEALSNRDIYRRLHLIPYDSVMSEEQLFLTLGATRLVLQTLVETYFNLGISYNPYSYLTLENAVKTAHNVSKDLSLKQKHVLRKKHKRVKAMTAAQIQREYYQRAVALPNLGEEDQQVLELWDRFLTDVEAHDIDALSQYIDWAAKLTVLDEIAARGTKNDLDSKLFAANMWYHFLSDEAYGRSVYDVMVDDGKMRTLPRKQRRPFSAPTNTRAYVRSQAVTHADNLFKRGYKFDFRVDWHSVSIAQKATVKLDDPYCTDLNPINDMFRKAGLPGLNEEKPIVIRFPSSEVSPIERFANMIFGYRGL